MEEPKKIFNLEGLDFKRYEREGTDIGLIISNLNRTPTERSEVNKEMLKFIEEAKKARAKLYSHAPLRS